MTGSAYWDAIPGGPALRAVLAALGLCLALAGCASTEQPDDGSGALLGYEEPNDPLETPNRLIFAVNDAVDTLILKPVAVTYDTWWPDPWKDVVRNFVRNLASPVVLANDLLQGNWARAEDTAARFFVNTATTGGLGDLVPDRHPYHDEDFGQTLATYGVDDGFYLVLPLLGPSSARDATGRVVDIFLNPLTYVEDTTALSIGARVAGTVDQRARNLEQIRQLKADSVDFYARVRSLYYQRRQAAIENRDAGLGPDQTQESRVPARFGPRRPGPGGETATSTPSAPSATTP
jgi:phospholipid-binding lipoprotein MlaA